MLSLRLLRCFAAVADELSFTAAAARLNMAQPALTRAIRQLEDQLEARLLDRDTRNVRLTKIGSAFLPEARAALNQLAHAERTGREMARGMLGHLKIGYTTFVAHDVLAPQLKQFNISRPNIRITLSNMGTEQQRIALVEREIDIAFMLGPFSIPTIEVRLIQTDPLVVVMPKGHRLAKKIPPRLRPEGRAAGRRHREFLERLQTLDLLGISPAQRPTADLAGSTNAVRYHRVGQGGIGTDHFPQVLQRQLRSKPGAMPPGRRTECHERHMRLESGRYQSSSAGDASIPTGRPTALNGARTFISRPPLFCDGFSRAS